MNGLRRDLALLDVIRDQLDAAATDDAATRNRALMTAHTLTTLLHEHAALYHAALVNVQLAVMHRADPLEAVIHVLDNLPHALA